MLSPGCPVVSRARSGNLSEDGLVVSLVDVAYLSPKIISDAKPFDESIMGRAIIVKMIHFLIKSPVYNLTCNFIIIFVTNYCITHIAFLLCKCKK